MLARFVTLPPSTLEKRERLSNSAFSACIDAAIVDDVPLGVDTQHDLDRARAIIGASPEGMTGPTALRSRDAAPKANQPVSTFGRHCSSVAICRFPPFEKAEENDVGEA